MSIKERVSKFYHSRPWVLRVWRARLENTIGQYLGEIWGLKIGLLEFSELSKILTVVHLHLWMFGIALWIDLE